jgi:hypothetical protein
MSLVRDPRRDSNQFVRPDLRLLFFESRPQWFPKAVDSPWSGRFATSGRPFDRSRPPIWRIDFISEGNDDIYRYLPIDIIIFKD